MEPQKSIGALWSKFTKTGQEYFTGNIDTGTEKIKIIVFKNNKKTKETQPDYNILISQPPQANPEQNQSTII